MNARAIIKQMGTNLGESRPLLRGWSHAVAILPAAAGAAVLAARAAGDAEKTATIAVYGVALTLLFSVSALYHCGRWSPRVMAVLRRLDHADISLLIAATYTPIVTVLLDGTPRVLLLCGVWLGALLGASLSLSGAVVRRSVLVAIYLVTGWIALFALPALYAKLGPEWMAMLLAGGVLYSVGAVVYSLRRPVLWPRVFGYHEVFHLLVIAASAVFFGIIARTVVPA